MTRPHHPGMPETEQGSPRRPSRAEMPIQPPEAQAADVSALQAIAGGVANPEQQKRALKWIIEQACQTYEWAYCPGQRDTDVMLGRQIAGKFIVSNLKKNASALVKDPRADAPKPQG